ncbi:MAG: amidase family protein [Gemmatimonadota bacterium]|nr:amidase family protein [Gemmatimonadota bacterium]
MIRSPLAAVLVLSGTLSAQEPLKPVVSTPPSSFVVQEASVSGIHTELATGMIDCAELTKAYLRRIEAYDDRGPKLNAILTVNPRAHEIAEELDQAYALSGLGGRPLHCVPVILKDNYNTSDLPTTGGSTTLARSVPRKDAFIVERLKQAGAVIIAKANLTELARGGTTVSSLGGQTRNPYDLTRTPGGSSGGTGAAIAASFGVLGTGSDTGQSTRSPASAQSLVGIRPTRGLLSRSGIIPRSFTQDEAGPITRTVEDAARMLDVIVGYDPADPITAFSVDKIPSSYTAFLDHDGLRGARVGLLLDFLGEQAVHREVNSVMEIVAETMTGMGATVVPIRIPKLVELTRDIALSEFEGKSAFNRYLEDLGSSAPVTTLQEFIVRGEFHPSIRPSLEADQRRDDGLKDPEYRIRILRRDDLRTAVMTVMAENELDAILYPHQRRLVVPIGEEQVERNGVLSNSTGFPAITVPGGFSAPMASAPIGVPIGIELLGPEWSEPTLISLAYAFEQATRIRRSPVSTPSLR